MLGFLYQGGWIMIPIGICSVLSLAFSAERAWFLWREHVSSGSFWADLDEPLSDFDFQEALERSKSYDGLLPRVVRSGLEATPLTRDKAVDAMEEFGLKKMPELERFLPALNFIAQVSPLLGLLGTVAGMIETFSVIADVGVGQPEMLAGGISKALITTASGLAVGIVTLFFHHLISRKVDELTHELEMGVRRVDDALKNEPGRGVS